MGIINILSKLKQNEKESGDLYRYISEKYSGRNNEISRLFSTLSEEERAHEREVDMALRIIPETNAAEVPEALYVVDKLVIYVQEVRDLIENEIDSLSPEKIVRIALELESELEERHHSFYYQVDDEKVKALFKSLASYDSSHSDKLKLFLGTKDT